MEGLGARIRELRIECGYTQPQLATLLHVSNAVVSFWENDVNEPKASYVRAMAECFHVTADFLLGMSKDV